MDFYKSGSKDFVLCNVRLDDIQSFICRFPIPKTSSQQGFSIIINKVYTTAVCADTVADCSTEKRHNELIDQYKMNLSLGLTVPIFTTVVCISSLRS